MSQSRKGLFVFAAIVILAFIIGSTLMQAAFLGVITLVGFIALVESIAPLKWLVSKGSQTLDVILFVVCIIATAQLGVTIAASLTIAGLGFTLFYAPKLRGL